LCACAHGSTFGLWRSANTFPLHDGDGALLTEPAPAGPGPMTASSSEELPWRRNVSDVARGLAQWVKHEFGKDAVLGGCTMPENGMANESIIFDIGQDRYVARLAPHQDTPYPTFPVFDLRLQRDLMELVRIRTNVPVPEVVRYEEDQEWLGTPFLVMRHIGGEVPRDSPPYVVQGWMTTLTEAERAQLEENTIGLRRLAIRHHSVTDGAPCLRVWQVAPVDRCRLDDPLRPPSPKLDLRSPRLGNRRTPTKCGSDGRTLWPYARPNSSRCATRSGYRLVWAPPSTR
jgi:hypothetical protein